MPDIRQQLVDANGGEELVFLGPCEAFDRAILGLVTIKGDAAVLYDRALCILGLVDSNGWDYETAVEWFEANTASASAGMAGGPVFAEAIVTATAKTLGRDGTEQAGAVKVTRESLVQAFKAWNQADKDGHCVTRDRVDTMSAGTLADQQAASLLWHLANAETQG